jgi:hypothetical protein
VTIPADTTVSNEGFHDVDYHSGEPYSGAEWTHSLANGSLIWQCETYDVNEDANALRWATLYNFRFDADRPPAAANALLGLFKPGSPGFVPIGSEVPGGCLGDLDGDGVRDLTDFGLFAAAYGAQFADAGYHAGADLDGDGVVDLTDFGLFANVFNAPCP